VIGPSPVILSVSYKRVWVAAYTGHTREGDREGFFGDVSLKQEWRISSLGDVITEIFKGMLQRVLFI